MGRASKVSSAAAKAQKAKSSAPAIPVLAQTPSRLSNVAAAYGWPVLYAIVACLIMGVGLPALAEMTPPGVDAQEVAKLAVDKAVAGKHGCGVDVCKGMGCPAGWTTGRNQNDPCKCACIRVQQNTPWDEEQKQKEQAKRARMEGAASSHDGDRDATKAGGSAEQQANGASAESIGTGAGVRTADAAA